MPFGNTYPVIELDSRHVNDVEVQPVVLSQGDSNGRVLKYALWDGQDAMSGTGLTARFCIDQDSGLYTSMTAVAGASTATFQAAVPMGGVEAGWHVGCIRVTDSGGRVINTRTFKVYVERAVIGGSAEQITAYADIIAGAESATDAATDAATLATNAAASAIAASGNRLGGTLDGTGTPDTAEDAWTGPILGAKVYGLSTQDGTPTPSAPVEIESVEAAGAVTASRNLLVTTRSAGNTYTTNGVAFTTNADKSITVTRTSSSSSNALFVYGVTLPPGTYTMSCIRGAVSNSVMDAYCGINPEGTTVARDNSTSGGLTNTFTLSNTHDVFFVVRVFSGGSPNGLTVYPQLEVGSTIHDYETNDTSTTALLPSTASPLRSLPDGTRDELTVGRDGSVTVVRRVGSATLVAPRYNAGEFDTTHGYSLYDTPAYCGLTDIATRTTANRGSIVCTSLQTVVANDTSKTNVVFWIAQNTLIVNIAGATTATEAKNAITALNAEIIYPLATPVIETLPSVAMPTVPSRNLTAWVDATDGDGAAMAAPWSIEYERDITYVIEQLEQAIADL